MTIGSAFLEGQRRVMAAPAVVAGVFLVTFLMAVPLSLAVRAETAASGVNYDWWQEFLGQASDLGKTFKPSVIGFAPVLENLTSLLDAKGHPTLVQAAGLAYGLVWLFLAGGVIDRFARQRRTRAHGFFAACGVYFFRFLRLAILAAAAFHVLFRYVHPWLFDRFYPWWTKDFTVERDAFVIRLVLYAIFIVLLSLVVLVFDYAKVRAVVEDRRSMLGALVAGARFVWRRPSRTTGLFVLNGGVFVLVLGLYALVAPGAGGPGLSVYTGLAVSQLYILARLWTRLLFYASETALFQGELAHAEYTAAPAPVWPESPAAETIVNTGA
jgi:hypothetical protein